MVIDLISDMLNDGAGSNISRYKYEYEEKRAKFEWMKLLSEHVTNPKLGADSKRVFNELVKYIFAVDSFDGDLTKGIGLIGMTGSGKTIAFHVLKQYFKEQNIKYNRGGQDITFNYRITSSRQLASMFSLKGHDVIFNYSNYANLCLDDLGAENRESRHFGDCINVIDEVFQNRYEKGLMTHFTSNLQLDKIKELYGDRFYSRLIGSCNIFKLSDKDYRL